MTYVVLIQIHDEGDKLASCIDALANQTLLPDKVIIVDDGTPNESVYSAYLKLETTNLLVDYCRAADNKRPNLDTVGKAMLRVWITRIFLDFLEPPLYNYVSIIDVDSLPEETYYEDIINRMDFDLDLVCASGIIQVGTKQEDLVSAKVIKRKDARGSGKVIRTDFLGNIPLKLFPEVAWDTWINVKAKLAGKKALQIPSAILYSTRPTTRLMRRNNYRDGRLTYHFGYNPLLVLYKVLFRGKDVWRGYQDAKRNQWRLPDPTVRKWFGWRYWFHFWK